MIDYFEKNLEALARQGVTEFQAKYNMKKDGYYHKFIAGGITHAFLKHNDIDQMVTSVNRHCDNLIEQYKAWPELGGIYLKCRQVEFYHWLNTQELIDKFPNTDAYLDYVIKNATDFSRAVHPCHFNDWHTWNVAIQKDLSWIVVDMDDLIQCETTSAEVYETELIYKTARKGASFGNPHIPGESLTGGDLDPDYVEQYIKNYFIKNPDCLSFLSKPKKYFGHNSINGKE